MCSPAAAASSVLPAGAVGEAYLLDAARALYRLDPDAQAHIDAVGLVEVAVHPAHLGPEDTLEWHRGQLDHGHVRPQLTGRGRNLGADPAGAYDDDRRSGRHRSIDGVGVGHGP